MVFSLDRIVPGFILIISLIFFYFSNLDYILFSIILFFILFDLYKSKIIISNFFLIFLIIFFLFSKIFFFNLTFYLFIILFLIILSLKKFKLYNEIILIIMILYVIIIYELLSLDRDMFFLIISISFINDTSAYFFGNFIKGPLIVPSISPNKTWSGTISSTLISFLLLIFLNFSITLSFLLSVSFFLGDLYFSYIKRMLKLKDFSNILLGHGGILDRLDSMFFAFMICSFYTIYAL